MKLEIEDLMEKLGVDRILMPYESQPWFHYDEMQGMTCSAEVRVGPHYDDIETEIQLLYDNPPEEAKPPPSKYGKRSLPFKTRNPIINGLLQIMNMRFKPSKQQQTWSSLHLKVKGDNYYNKFPKWDEKGCEFFRSVIEALQMGIMPNFDELVETLMQDDSDWGGGRRGRIGRKAPKANAAALLGMKK